MKYDSQPNLEAVPAQWVTTLDTCHVIPPSEISVPNSQLLCCLSRIKGGLNDLMQEQPEESDKDESQFISFRPFKGNKTISPHENSWQLVTSAGKQRT